MKIKDRINDDKLSKLPGVLTAVKPVAIKKGSEDLEQKELTYVGFNATYIKFDANKPEKYEGYELKTSKNSAATSRTGTAISGRTDSPGGRSLLDDIEVSSQGFVPGTPAVGAATSHAIDKLKFKKDATMDQLRNYITLMDEFSLHNFIIYEGKTLRETPEFQSFQRSYLHQWGSISSLIFQLEELMQNHEVRLAIINGPKLFALANMNLPKADRQQLLDVIANVEQVTPFLNFSHSSEGPKQFHASVIIQSVIRKFIAGRKFRRMLTEIQCATKIQSHVRLYLFKLAMPNIIRNTKDNFEGRWRDNRMKLDSMWQSWDPVVKAGKTELRRDDSSLSSGEGRAEGRERRVMDPQKALQESTEGTGSVDQSVLTEANMSMQSTLPSNDERLIIHIPSISTEEYIRLCTDSLHPFENAGIGNIYQLAAPNVHLVYILPVHLSSEQMAYFDRLLSVMQISSLPKRLHFVVPELVTSLPPHTSLAQVLWCSTRSLRILKNMVRRHSNTIITSSCPGWADKRIANFLNVPLLGPDPITVDTITSRSFLKKIFLEASINIPVGAHDVTRLEDFFLALTRLITSNIDVRKWIIKLNRDMNGESTVIFDTTKSSLIGALRGEMEMLLAKNKHDIAAWYQKPIQLSARKRLLTMLQKDIANRVVICRRDIYHNWDFYARMIAFHGAVIEADPIEPLGQVDALFFIDPHGNVQICGGLEVVQDKYRQAQAYVWPQNIVPQQALAGATSSLAEVLYRKWNVIGPVTATFSVFWDAYDHMPRLWALDMKLGYTASFANYGTVAMAWSPGGVPGGQAKLPLSLIPETPKGVYYVHVPMATHSGLKQSRDDVFFKLMRMRGVAFDTESRVGTLFYVLDGIVGGAVSMVCIGNTRERAITTALHMAQVLNTQFGVENTSGLRLWMNASSVLSGIKRVHKQWEKQEEERKKLRKEALVSNALQQVATAEKVE
jgi:hypothetical protein